MMEHHFPEDTVHITQIFTRDIFLTVIRVCANAKKLRWILWRERLSPFEQRLDGFLNPIFSRKYTKQSKTILLYCDETSNDFQFVTVLNCSSMILASRIFSLRKLRMIRSAHENTQNKAKDSAGYYFDEKSMLIFLHKPKHRTVHDIILMKPLMIFIVLLNCSITVCIYIREGAQVHSEQSPRN
jgi:hypothetical protein